MADYMPHLTKDWPCSSWHNDYTTTNLPAHTRGQISKTSLRGCSKVISRTRGDGEGVAVGEKKDPSDVRNFGDFLAKTNPPSRKKIAKKYINQTILIGILYEFN